MYKDASILRRLACLCGISQTSHRIRPLVITTPNCSGVHSESEKMQTGSSTVNAFHWPSPELSYDAGLPHFRQDTVCCYRVCVGDTRRYVSLLQLLVTLTAVTMGVPLGLLWLRPFQRLLIQLWLCQVLKRRVGEDHMPLYVHSDTLVSRSNFFYLQSSTWSPTRAVVICAERCRQVQDTTGWWWPS